MRDERGGVTLTLTPPTGKPPTLDRDMLESFGAALDGLKTDPPRVLVVRSAEPKYFCVGANIHVLQGLTDENIGAWVERGHRVFNQLEDLPCPVVARVSGYAMGGGLELALACDVIFACRSAQLGLTEARLGFIPGWGGCRRLVQRVGIPRAKRLFFAGQAVGADHAYQLGLVDHVADDNQLDDDLAGYLGDLLACSACAQRTFKALVDGAVTCDRAHNAQAEADHSRGCLQDPTTRGRLDEFLASRRR
ncbi:MAG: enoyl-CoA hydratase/isomerase family protein [Planctomycetota bacterium]